MKLNEKFESSFSRLALLISVGALGVLGQGCGKQAYVIQASQSPGTAPGTFTVPAKVDVLLVQDDTGSSHPIYANIASQLDSFLTNLQGAGWDYHFATIPLTSYRAVTQVQASQYDPNWGSQWIAPYPGAIASQIETVAATDFRMPGSYSAFLGSNYQGSSDSLEPAFSNLETMLRDSSMTSTGFIRPDALLAVVLLSTGDDTSGRNICTGAYAQSDGWTGPCDEISIAENGSNPSIVCGDAGANPQPYCNNYQSSLTPYESMLQYYKGQLPSQQSELKFYAVVSAEHQVSGEQCLAGTNAYIGSRYEDVASYLGGQSFDICSVSIPTVLQSIASDLADTLLTLYTDYLFIAQQPNPTSIVVTRNPGGNAANAVTIPQDPNNGWSYIGQYSGYTTSVGSPSAPLTLNEGSGWAVQLNGSAILSGADTATVSFTPAGAQNSAAH